MIRSQTIAAASVMGLIFSGLGVGCRDTTPPPQRVPIPAAQPRGEQQSTEREQEQVPLLTPRPAPTRDEVKPLPPAHNDNEGLPPFDDAPLVSQHPPEQAAFVDAYRKVGSPRIMVLVDRAAGSDDANVRSVDYGAIESIMTDWLANNGNVTILSPSGAGAMRNGSLPAADIVVNVQAQTTHQTHDGSSMRLVAEATNAKGGQSIGRAVVDVPSPLDKTQINRSTRFVARKLMDDMTQTWLAPPPPDHDAGPRDAPAATAPEVAPSTQPQNR